MTDCGFELYPPASEEFPSGLNESDLREMLGNSPESMIYLFLLGNHCARSGRYAEACELYKRLLALDPRQARVCCNLGFVYRCMAARDKALEELKRALKLDAELNEAEFLTAVVLWEQGKPKRSKSVLKRLLKKKPDHVGSLLLLARIAQGENDPVEAEKLLEQAYAVNSEHLEVRKLLGYLYYYRGRKLFVDGSLDQAMRVWKDSLVKHGNVMSSDKDLSRDYRGLLSKFASDRRVEKAIEQFGEALSVNSQTRDMTHAVVSQIIFSLGLVPECYEPLESLDISRGYWAGQVQMKVEVPYARFRLGLILAEEGKFEDALKELLHCRDICPRKKQESIRLKELTEAVKELRDLVKSIEVGGTQDSDPEAWSRFGFDSELEVMLWKKAGFSAADGRLWRDIQFAPERAKEWVKIGVAPLEALEWSAGGLDNPVVVKQWRRAGFSASEAKEWIEHCPIEAGLAIQFKKGGIVEPQAAYQWSRVFMVPSEAFAWNELGFSPTEAWQWRERGVRDPFAAKRLREESLAGISPPVDEEE